MQDKEEKYVPESILQSEDFEEIKSAVLKKFKNSEEDIRIWATKLLHKLRLNNVYWGPIVTKILVYFATSTEKFATSTTKKEKLDEGILHYLPTTWANRLDNPHIKTEAAVDCLYFLYKMKAITLQEVVVTPNRFACFARLYNVHDFMDIRHEGFSPVYLYLLAKLNNEAALTGIEYLYEIYQSDFKYIISPDLAEIRLLTDRYTSHKAGIFKFLKQCNLSFPAIDNARICMYEPIMEPYTWYHLKKPTKRTSAQRLVYDLSKEAYTTRINETSSKESINSVVQRIFNDVKFYLTQAYNVAYKRDKSVFSLLAGCTSTSQFPLHALPMEILEMILEFESDMAVRAIFCLSKDCNRIKRVFDWRRFLKRQYPIKYHVINETLAENPKFKWSHYCSVQNRYRTNWSQGTFSKFALPGTPWIMDDNVLIGCNTFPRTGDDAFESNSNDTDILYFSPNDQEGTFEMTKDHVGYYWLNWNDTKEYYKINFFAPPKHLDMCLIDTVAPVPKVAFLYFNQFQIWEGSVMIAEAPMGILNNWNRKSFYHDGSLFIGPFEYRFDNNLKQTNGVDSHVLDIGRSNNLMICGTYSYPLTICSRSNFKVIEYIEEPTEIYRAAFLDDHLFAAQNQDSIYLFDMRNLSGFVSQIDLTPDNRRYKAVIDGPNQRAITYIQTSNVVNVWNLKTCTWTTAFQADQPDYLINSRYLCAHSDNNTTVFDFNNNMNDY